VIQFKHETAREELGQIDGRLLVVVLALNGWMEYKYGTSLTLTQLISTAAQDAALGRVSATHRERRGVDIRIHALSEECIAGTARFLLEHFKCRVQTVWVRHGSGDNDHVHLQVCVPEGVNWTGFEV
jgi:hypothetical protein